ncbi:MAG TPA: polysaccharide biosynthesis protein [Peptococcaceae bacterium]|nr:MAG: O-antigen flippase Wzx [Moorella sp. 60_41]HBT47661.1 polysaccharide biosynthesis protein [Peptococcaceae bacterium]
MNAAFARLKALLPKSSFARNVAVLAGGTAVGQAIVVLASPILTRLYTPEDFGVLAVYSSLLGILSTVAALRYELAIPLPEKDEDAAALVVLSLIIVLGMSLLVGLGVWLGGEQVARWVNAETLRPHLWLLPVGMGFVGTYQVLNYWTTRRKLFDVVSLTKLTQSGTQVAVQLVSGALGVTPLGLIIGHIAGQSAGIGVLFRRSGVSLRLFPANKLVALARQHWKFPVFNSWGALINIVGIQAAPLLLTTYFGTAISGLFMLTMRVLTLPASLIGNAVAQVFYPTIAAQTQKPEAVRTLLARASTALLPVAFAIFALVGLWGRELFALIFGAEWLEAGLYASYLSPWLFLNFISSPLSTFVLAKGRQDTAMWITLYETVLRLSVLLFAGFMGSPLLAVRLYGLAGMVISGVYISWIFRLAGSSIWIWLSSIRSYVFAAVLLLTALSSLKAVTAPPVSFGLSVVGIGLFTIWSVKTLRQESRETRA